MTKPGFVKKRIDALFKSSDEDSKEQIVELFGNYRNNVKSVCYCGIVNICSCPNPDLIGFKIALQDGFISEETLLKIIK
jgi:hypothetical protein